MRISELGHLTGICFASSSPPERGHESRAGLLQRWQMSATPPCAPGKVDYCNVFACKYLRASFSDRLLQIDPRPRGTNLRPQRARATARFPAMPRKQQTPPGTEVENFGHCLLILLLRDSSTQNLSSAVTERKIAVFTSSSTYHTRLCMYTPSTCFSRKPTRIKMHLDLS